MHPLQKIHAENDPLPPPRITKSYPSGWTCWGDVRMKRSRCSSCDFSFLNDRRTLGLHRPYEVGGRRPFKRQSITNFPYDALLQRMNEVDACVAAGYFGGLQVQLGQLVGAAQRLTVRDDFGNHSPFVGSSRRYRLWVEQKCLRSSCSRAITPRGKDSVARHNASSEVRNIVEGCTLGSDNHVGKQRIL